MNLAHRLQIKYGLESAPSDASISRWHIKYLLYRLKGSSEELAGRQAASDVFEDFESIKYASAADTIDALLTEIQNKERQK